MTKKSIDEITPDIQNSSTQLFYADRIINFAFGPAVSKLTFGMEVGPKTFSPTTTVVMPTSALIDALSFIQEAAHENKELKDGLIKGFDAIREQYSKL
jgi:hypothetical protein